MRNAYLPGATAALMIVAALVACHGAGVQYNPAATRLLSSEPSSQLAIEPAVKITCKAPKKGPGSYILYFASGNVKRGTFRAATGKSSGANWYVYKYVKVKPTPTPNPTPTPHPTPTPRMVKYYYYFGQFAMKNKQTGCAFLIATTSGKPRKGTHFNALTSGLSSLKPGHYKASLESSGPVKSITISHLSSKGGAGSVDLDTSKGKYYTSGSITLNGRIIIKAPGDIREMLQPLLEDY